MGEILVGLGLHSGAVSVNWNAVREQLGLRLEAKRAKVATYVIEKLERPSEN